MSKITEKSVLREMIANRLTRFTGENTSPIEEYIIFGEVHAECFDEFFEFLVRDFMKSYDENRLQLIYGTDYLGAYFNPKHENSPVIECAKKFNKENGRKNYKEKKKTRPRVSAEL